MKNEKFITWIKRHKKELIVAGGLAVAAVAIGVAYNNQSIKDTFLDNNDMPGDIMNKLDIQEANQTSFVPKIKIPSDIKLTGNRYTATELGSKLRCSAREVNKRLINEGFAKRWPNGDLDFTAVGKRYGELTCKKTKYDHWFYNIEWDEAVLPYIS